MKVKGTSVWEQYIEYVVIAVAVLLLGWFGWSSFATKIEVSTGDRSNPKVTSETVNDALYQAAMQLKPKLSDGAPSPVTLHAPEPWATKFSESLSSSVSPQLCLTLPTIDMTAELDVNQDVESVLRMYVHPVIPAPEEIGARQWFGTITESEIERVDELDPLIVGPPHDTSWIEVYAKLDIDSVVESFSTAIGEFEAIPEQWYDGAADIIDIEIEREVLGKNGWTSSEIVSALPGKLSYRTRLADGSIDAMERDVIVRELRRGLQQEIRNPAFYDCKNNTPSSEQMNPTTWSETETSALSTLEKKLIRIGKRIGKLQVKILKLEENIEKERRGGGGSGGSPLGGGGAGGGSGKNTRLARLQTQLARELGNLDAMIVTQQELQEELDALDLPAEDGGEEVMSGEIWVWGHDMSVQAGETYRYRMVIQFSNPFFGHKPSLYPEQKQLAQKVTMATVASDWSDAIEIQKPLQWFVLGDSRSSASLSSDVFDPGSISAEVFEFSDGSWTQSTVTVRVGQRVGDPRPDGFASDWFVLDILEDSIGDVVLLQNLDSGAVQLIRPEFEHTRAELLALRQQVRDQSLANNDEDDTQPDLPKMPPRGPSGGGGGGGAF